MKKKAVCRAGPKGPSKSVSSTCLLEASAADQPLTCTHPASRLLLAQVVKKSGVQLQNRLVPEGPVQQLARQIEDLQPDFERVLQVSSPVTVPLSVGLKGLVLSIQTCCGWW